MVAAALSWTGGLAALVYVPIPDEELLSRSIVVVHGTVLSSRAAPDAARPSTDHLVQVEDLIKGSLSGSTVLVRQEGGLGPDGSVYIPMGVPRLRRGDRVLLFLVPGAGDTWRLVDEALALFHEENGGGRRGPC